ncbi:MAG: hypothetical protein B6229_02610 [Spirochaetaceae bacterium 4572_7]|nr:MAG: hypothetical protein B6229_02610 [Spirochaetaceae bacterium 4572_7]
MKKTFLLVILMIFSFSSLFSYQWPSNKKFLSSFFGSVKGSTVQDGIEFVGSNQAIYPLTDGEILYYQDNFQFGDLNYSGAEGNILVLKHKGEFNSFYRNFQPIDKFDFLKNIKQSEMLGVSVIGSDNFMFSVYDSVNTSYINPQQILPFLEDEKKPVISRLYLENEGKRYRISRNKQVPGGLSTLYIDAWDVVMINNKLRRFSPFSLNVFIDGFEKYNVSYSSIKEIDDNLYLHGDEDVLLDKFVSGDGLLFGGDIYFTRGRSLIEIVVKDIDGNEASKSYSVVID